MISGKPVFLGLILQIFIQQLNCMKIILLSFILFVCSGTYAQYFNLQLPAGSKPAIFGAGVISDGLTNRDMAISPSNDELFYTLQYGTQFNAILYC